MHISFYGKGLNNHAFSGTAAVQQACRHFLHSCECVYICVVPPLHPPLHANLTIPYHNRVLTTKKNKIMSFARKHMKLKIIMMGEISLT
jgi:hypothetical protein